jgi:hypothetical protein
MYIIHYILKLTNTAFCKGRDFFVCYSEEKLTENPSQSSDDSVTSSEVADEFSRLCEHGAQHSTTTRSLTTSFDDPSHSWKVIRILLIHGCVYYVVALLGFSVMFGKLSVIDSLYLATTIFTTIGYGDIHPEKTRDQIFALLLAFYGIVILGMLFGIIGERIVDRNNTHASARKKNLEKEIVQAVAPEAPCVDSMRACQDECEETSLFDDIIYIAAVEAPTVLLVAGMAVMIGYFEGWSAMESIYWLGISSTTIDFGDYSPRSEGMRLFCVFFLPFAVAVIGEILSRIASVYLQRHRSSAEKAFLTKALALADIKNLDLNHDGKVTDCEFLRYMLVALQKVDKQNIDVIMAAFHRLDTSGDGFLSRDDLMVASGSMRDRYMRATGLLDQEPCRRRSSLIRLHPDLHRNIRHSILG